MKRYRRLLMSTVLLLNGLFFFVYQVDCFALDKSQQIDSLMSTYYQYGKFNGTVLVAEKGKIIYKKAFGFANMEWNIPNATDTKFRLASITKQFTAMLVLQLAEQGKLDLNGKISDYLPYYRKDTGGKITIHQLLIHTSGIPSYTSQANYFETVSRNPYPVKEFVRKYCSGDLEFEPGSKFRYNNSGYFILGAIIEEVVGKPYDKALAEKILQPLGMKDTGYDVQDRIIRRRAEGYVKALNGYKKAPYIDMSQPYAAGSLYSTVEDMYRWDRALYTQKLLSNKYKKLMFSPHYKIGKSNYGYGWFVKYEHLTSDKDSVLVVKHGGSIPGFNSLIMRFIKDGHLIMLLHNTGTTEMKDMGNALMNILYGEPYPQPKKSIADVLSNIIVEKGVQAAVTIYHELKAQSPDSYCFDEYELNKLGYKLLEEKRARDAVKIFALNAEQYPKSYNVYDSLGEAYLALNQKEMAIINFAKSLQLNPHNTNALEMLKNISENNDM